MLSVTLISQSFLTVFNNALYFVNNLGTSKELWKYDGVNTPSEVQYTGSVKSPVSARAPATHTAAGVTRTRVWARARMPPWLPATHARLSDEPPHGASVALISQNSLTVFNSELWFRADDGTNGFQLWKYDFVDTMSVAADIGPVSARARRAHSRRSCTHSRLGACSHAAVAAGHTHTTQ